MTDTPTDLCDRCKTPLDGERFGLHIDLRGGEPRSVEMTLCEDCLDSLRRWLFRRSRSEREDDTPPPGDASRRSRRRPAGLRRTRYTDELDRAASWLHARAVLTVVGVFLAFAAAYGVVAYGLSRK
jgi:hypothetical protein